MCESFKTERKETSALGCDYSLLALFFAWFLILWGFDLIFALLCIMGTLCLYHWGLCDIGTGESFAEVRGHAPAIGA